MRHTVRVRRAAQQLQSRSFKQLEKHALAYTRDRYARRFLPRLRFVLLPWGLNFRPSKKQEQLLADRALLILYAHLAIPATLGVLTILYPGPVPEMLAVDFMLGVLFCFAEYIALVYKHGIGIILHDRWQVACELVLAANTERDAFLAQNLTSLSVSVGELMESRLTALDAELTGEHSRLNAVQTSMRRYHAEAMRHLERQKTRVREFKKGDAPAQVTSVLQGFQDVVARYEQVIAGLDKFRARVGAYLDECRARVRGLVTEVADLEAARALAALQRQVAQDERLAADTISATLSRLQSGMLELRRDVLEREHLAREIVAELPYSGDIGSELDRIEEILGRASDTARLRVPA